MALILPCGRPWIHTIPLFCSSGMIVTEAASALVADSYFPIAGKISEVFNSVGATGFISYFEMMASTVGFFLGSHVCVCCVCCVCVCCVCVCCACTDMVCKDNTITP